MRADERRDIDRLARSRNGEDSAHLGCLGSALLGGASLVIIFALVVRVVRWAS